MLAAFAEHAGVLPAPAPAVTLDGIENGLLIFQAIAYVQSPRLAGGVRSDLLFTILELLQAGRVPLAVPTVVLSPPEPPRAAAPAPPPPLPLRAAGRLSRASRAAASHCTVPQTTTSAA